jgi:hypothetical protein
LVKLLLHALLCNTLQPLMNVETMAQRPPEMNAMAVTVGAAQLVVEFTPSRLGSPDFTAPAVAVRA